MSALLKSYMETIRMLQAWDVTKRDGEALPDDILGRFASAIASNDVDSVHALLDEHFPDRTKPVPGNYHVHELYPCLSQAARLGRVEILDAIFVAYTHLSHSVDFVAREAADGYAKDTLLFLLGHGWELNMRRDGKDSTILESILNQWPQDGDKDGDGNNEDNNDSDNDNSKRRDMVCWLLDHGADLNNRGPSVTDNTAMSNAVRKAPVDFVKTLLDEYGGDVRRGQLLHNALMRRPIPREKKNDIVEMLGLLLDRGAPLNVIMYASDEASARAYRLIDLGTPLHDAAQRGNTEAVQYLLARGADTRVTSSTKHLTAQQWAANKGHAEIAAMIQLQASGQLAT